MRSIWYKYYVRKLLTRVKELIRIVKTNKIRKMYEKDLVKYPKGKVKFLRSNETTRDIVRDEVYRVTDTTDECTTYLGDCYSLGRFTETTLTEYYKQKYPEVFK